MQVPIPSDDPTLFINIAGLKELKVINTAAQLPGGGSGGAATDGVSFGAAVTLSDMQSTLTDIGSAASKGEKCHMAAIARHLQLVVSCAFKAAMLEPGHWRRFCPF